MQCNVLHLSVVFLSWLSSLQVRAFSITTSDYGPRNCTTGRIEELWTAENFPNPVTDVDYCGRGCKPSRVCDPKNVITHNEADQIDQLIADGSDDISVSSDCNGTIHLFTIAIISSLNISDDNSSNVYTTGSAFLYTLHRHTWRFSSCKYDIVILLSRDDHMLWISVEDSLQNITTVECIDKLEAEFQGKLRRGDYINLTLKRLIKRLRSIIQEGTCAQAEYINPGIPSEALLAALGVFVILLVHGAYMIRTDMLRKQRASEPHKPKRKKRNYTLIVRRPSRASLRMSRLFPSQNEKRMSRQSSQEDKTLSQSKSERRLSRLSSQDKALSSNQSDNTLSRQSSCEEKLLKAKEPNGIKNRDKYDEIGETDVNFFLIDENDPDNRMNSDQVFEMKTIP